MFSDFQLKGRETGYVWIWRSILTVLTTGSVLLFEGYHMELTFRSVGRISDGFLALFISLQIPVIRLALMS